MMKRYALITGHRADPKTITAYLPSNYKILWVGEWEEYPGGPVGPAVVIEGRDYAGWTLHQYVIPRLGSGMIHATEIDLSHPVMKLIPA